MSSCDYLTFPGLIVFLYLSLFPPPQLVYLSAPFPIWSIIHWHFPCGRSQQKRKQQPPHQAVSVCPPISPKASVGGVSGPLPHWDSSSHCWWTWGQRNIDPTPHSISPPDWSQRGCAPPTASLGRFSLSLETQFSCAPPLGSLP